MRAGVCDVVLEEGVVHLEIFLGVIVFMMHFSSVFGVRFICVWWGCFCLLVLEESGPPVAG